VTIGGGGCEGIQMLPWEFFISHFLRLPVSSAYIIIPVGVRRSWKHYRPFWTRFYALNLHTIPGVLGC